MTQSNNEVVIPISLIMVKCQWWLSALIEQINRVEKNINSPIYEEQVQRMADNHFLKISLKKLCEWLTEFDKYVEEFENILKTIASLGHTYRIRHKKNIKIFSYDKKEGHKI